MADLTIAGKAFTDGIHKREINSTCALQTSDAVIVTWTYNTAQPLPACIRKLCNSFYGPVLQFIYDYICGTHKENCTF